MGIAGLLPQLRSITRRAHVSKYRGQTMAVDAYCLLHRGSYSCARELVEGEPTDRHVQYCMGRVELLLAAGVRPMVVFDGDRLPNKADEERSRERSREENKARARALWAQGNKAAAMECYQKAVDIQPAHAKQFVEALKQRNIPYIVAPYEADAQMAYLALNNLVDAVLTEDSDLLCYGCPTVFFKMDKGGEGEEVRLADLPTAKELAFQGFGHELFQEMCVLAGCDFVASLPGIGIKKAHQHLRRTRCFLKVVRALRFDGVKIPEGYERRVQRALWTFKHQRVYCPRRRAAVHLHEVVGGELAAGARVPAAAQLEEGEPDFLGPPLPHDVAEAIAVGEYH
jgi:exonuclease-1